MAASVKTRVLALAIALLVLPAALVRGERLPIRAYTTADGLVSADVRDIVRGSRGFLWFCTADGLSRFDGNTFVNFTTAQGLSSDAINAIAEDRAGFLYVGGGAGIDRFDPRSGRVRHFTAADGVPAGVLKDAFCDRDGVLWFGMSNGLARLAPKPTDAPPPPTLIGGLRIGGESFPVSALGERAITLADLPPDRNDVQVDVIGLGFGAGERLRYQYRVGRDAGWSPPTDQRSVTLVRLGSGHYDLAARAVSADGAASEPATIAFTILRPIWLRWWFVAFAAAGLAALAYAVHRNRMARALQLAHLRTRIATDLHDDIGANLTRIALEAVNNVVRHSRCSTMDIDLRVDASRLILIIADDGVGFDSDGEFEGQGLRSLSRRAAALAGSCEIRSRIGAGTTVIVTAPI